MKLRVVLEKSEEGGFTAYVPSLPGCISEGDTREEALKNIQVAVELYLEPWRTDVMSELHRITVNRDQCGGRPCIRGLRIRVKDVLELLAAGASREEILADYPYLEPEDITAALEFAARQSDHRIVHVA